MIVEVCALEECVAVGVSVRLTGWAGCDCE